MTMRNTCFLFIVSGCLALFSSCQSSLGVSTTLVKKLPPNESNLPIVVFQAPSDQIPHESVLVGSVKAYNTQRNPLDNDSAYVVDLAKAGARKSGGNALVIKELRKPSRWYIRTEVKADIIRAEGLVVPELSDSFPAPAITYEKKEYKRTRDKGTINVRISYPFLGVSHIRPMGHAFQRKHDLVGMGVELEYYYRKECSISLGLSGKFSPNIENDELNIFHIELMHNHRIKKIALGYGVSLAHNSLDKFDWEVTEDKIHRISYHSGFDYWNAGLVTSAHWMFKEWFGVGFKYYPAFFCTNTRKFRFEHTFGIDVSWRFHIFSRKRAKT